MKKTLFAAVGLGMLALAGCTTAQVATVTTTITQAETDAKTAVTAYEATLGIAEVAAVANPTLAPVLTKIEAVAGPIVADLTPLETDVNADAPTIEGLVGKLNAQVASLTAAAAPAVKAVAN